jgi:hypothetical protein
MPNDIPAETGSALTEFIQQTKDQTVAALGEDWELKKPLELELSTVAKGKVGGGMDIRVLNFGAKVEGEEVQKMKISIGPKDDAVEEEKKARIAKAKAIQSNPRRALENEK